MKCVQNCIVFSKRCSNCLFLRCVDYSIEQGQYRLKLGAVFPRTTFARISSKENFPISTSFRRGQRRLFATTAIFQSKGKQLPTHFYPHKVGMYKVRTRHFESKSGNLKKQVCQKYMWTDGHSALTQQTLNSHLGLGALFWLWHLNHLLCH